MQEQLGQLKEKFDQLSTRERYIVMAMPLVIIFFVWDQLLYSPLSRNAASATGQIDMIYAQDKVRNSELSSLVLTLQDDPNTDLQRQIKAVENNVAKLNKKIEQLTAGLIPPEQMPKVLEKLLTQNRGLKLIKVTSLPVEEIGLDESAKTKGSAGADNGYLYRYGAELELEGTFFQILDYLKDLEQMNWRLIWSSLEYDVQQYPIAVVRLRINTLSTDSGWIGI